MSENDTGTPKKNSTLDHVLELTNVAGPRMLEQDRNCLGRYPLDGGVRMLSPCELQKVLDEHGQIVAAKAKWWKRNRDHVEPIK